MFIDLGNRQVGKTTTLIHDAHFSGLPIIVPNQGRKNTILQQARQMGIEISCYTVAELDNSVEIRNHDVLVDELDDVLNVALGGVNVVKATLSRKGRV